MLRHWQLKLCGSLDERCRFFGAHVQECIGILEQLRCTGYDKVARLPIHGDMCRANVVFSRKRLSGIIDFGHCCFDTAIRDITIALRYECANINEDFKLDLVSARKFLRAYNKISPLSPQQIELIPAIAMAEAVDLLWWRIFQITNTRVPQASMRSVGSSNQNFEMVPTSSIRDRPSLAALITSTRALCLPRGRPTRLVGHFNPSAKKGRHCRS